MEKREILMIATDLDGTLLTADKKLTSKNKEVIEKVIESGAQFVPATGRTVSGIPEFLKEIEGIRYIILSNGAAVLDMKTGEFIYRNQFTAQEAMEIINLLRKYDTMFDFYADGFGRIWNCFLENLDLYNIEPVIQQLVRKTRKAVPSLEGYLEETKCYVEKFNMFFADQEKRRQAFEELSKMPNIAVTTSIANNIEINKATCNKGNALLALAKHLGIDIAKTMAFGDGTNDIALLKAAGIGIAMKNAAENVKASADDITEYTNDENGVAVAIEKWDALL